MLAAYLILCRQVITPASSPREHQRIAFARHGNVLETIFAGQQGNIPMTKRPKKRPNKTVQPKQNTVVAESQVTVQHQQQIHSGPIPSPDVMRQYDLLLPGAAERILQMAEREAQHQHDIVKNSLDAQRREIRRGQILGFLIGISSLSSSVVALYLNHPTTAGILGGTTVVGLVTVFVIGRKTDP